jgi:nucleotide-binding universal stress UspA family protein
VSPANPVLTIRRILVALDASPDSLAALQTAADLARRTGAELVGLFVEDIELLRMADSPYALEILYPSAQGVPLSRATMEVRLRAQSEQARRALQMAAEGAKVPWSFRTVRGPVASELLTAALEADLVAMGRLGWSFGQQVRIGSAALELVASAIPLLLLSDPCAPAGLRPCAYFDGSPTARRAVLAAAQLADAGTRAITILVDAEDDGKARSLEQDAAALLQGQGLDIQFRRLGPAADEASLLRALRAEETGIFVVGGRELFHKVPSLEAVLRERRIPVLLLRNGSAAAG